MYLFVLVLNKKELLNKVMETFLEVGIKQATILDSKGMGETIMECEIPLVGGLRQLIYNQCRSDNHTIFSVVDSLKKVDDATNAIEKICGNLSEPGTGIAFALSLDFVKGLATQK